MRKRHKDYPAWDSWGVNPEKLLHQLDPQACAYCGRDFSSDGYRCLVGFSNARKYLQSPSYKVGVGVYKCPNCFKLSWCHAWDVMIELIEYDREKGQQFYWPEAEAAYQAMVAECDKK